jgi:hypothetical protein
MKTPTMLYLAYRGWFAANVPIVPGIDLPNALVTLPPARVFWLEMAPERLLELRHVRARKEGIPVDSYASMDQIRRESQQAQESCAKRGWQRIDVTGKSVEEAGREIIASLPAHRTHG